MTKLFRAFAVVALVSAASPALAAEQQTMIRDGVTYVYWVKETPNATLIKGRAQGGLPFSLRVAKGRVTGLSNGQEISFPLTDVVASKPSATQISSN
ncbi:hypothetical protein [Sphingomonas sp.]|uniref:hypothetical protein n=1 Tax=Sphingomonas sp. TaxID=28214 RepID=UPI0025D0EB5D|nr:hypothetical protein [Sphingomonas sp.]